VRRKEKTGREKIGHKEDRKRKKRKEGRNL
jgi:hypothetical protein